MGFDAEGYRKAAKAAGISDEEIERDILEETGGITPVNKPPAKEDVQIGGQYDWMIPAAGAAGIGLGATGLGLAYKSIKDRLINKPPEMPRIEPSMDQSRYAGPGRVEPTFEAASTEGPPKSPYSPAEQEMLAQSEKNRIAKQVEAATKAAAQGEVPGSTKPTTAPQAVVPQGFVGPESPFNQGPKLPELVGPPAPPPSEIKEAGGQKKQITTKVEKETAVIPLTRDAKGNVVYPDTMSPAARAGAEEFKKKYPNHAADLEKKNLIGVMGFGAADNSLYNTYGAEGRKAVLDYFRQGQPLGKYENYLPFAQKIGENVPAVPPRDVPELMSRVPSDVEAGNYGKLGIPASIGGEKGGVVKGQKQVAAALKAGGPALLLLSAAGAANAREAARTIGEGLLPIGMTPSEAGAPVLPPSVLAAQKRQLEEMQKLGSPYRKR